MFRFYGVGWCEDEKVAERGLLIWESMVKVIAHWKAQSKSKRADCKSYTNLVDHYQDKSLQNAVFQGYCKEVECVFDQISNEQTMLPFFSDALVEMFASLMSMVIKRNVLNDANTALKLVKERKGKST